MAGATADISAELAQIDPEGHTAHAGARGGAGHPDELELELIQSHMTQKPMLRGEVGARALRV